MPEQAAIKGPQKHWYSRYQNFSLKWLLINSIIIGVAIVFWYASGVTGFRISEKLNAKQYRDLKTIEQLVIRQSRWSFDAIDVQQQIAALDWVLHATARLLYNGVVEITLVRVEPIARYNDKQFIDSKGAVHAFESNTDYSHLLHLQTVPQNIQLFIQHQAYFQKIMTTTELTPTLVSISNYGSWVLWLSNGVEINIGIPPWDKKLQLLAQMYSFIAQYSAEPIIRVDLRNPAGITVAYKTPQEESEDNGE